MNGRHFSGRDPPPITTSLVKRRLMDLRLDHRAIVIAIRPPLPILRRNAN